MEWAKRNPTEFIWLTEMMVRKELGGYCPEDPMEFAFMSAVIASKHIKNKKSSVYSRLQNLINRSK